jgi:hemerythrin-like metal-binding protein
MPVIDVDSILEVATDFQNEDHRLEAELLNCAVDALAALAAHEGSEEDADACLDALVRHMGQHFQREDDAMRRTSFPPFPVHQAEHQRELDEVSERVNQFRRTRDAAALHHYLANDAVQWFTMHLQTMDFITARWLAASEG